MDECKFLAGGTLAGAGFRQTDAELTRERDSRVAALQRERDLRVGGEGAAGGGRGLHSSTVRLNLSAFCGIGVHVGVVDGMFGRFQGVQVVPVVRFASTKIDIRGHRGRGLRRG